MRVIVPSPGWSRFERLIECSCSWLGWLKLSPLLRSLAFLVYYLVSLKIEAIGFCGLLCSEPQN